MGTIVNNTLLHTSELLRKYVLNVLTKRNKGREEGRWGEGTEDVK